MTLNFGDYNSSTGLTQFSGTDVSVTSFSQNGLSQGSFNNLSIDKSGNVAINYSNGSTRVIAQIPVVQFYAQDQLQRVTGNAYESTITSGSPRYSTAGTNGAGTLTGSSLESSNVDIATQFTEMIQAQQIYSANSKIITTVNNMLNTIINAVQ
jgi:flagellar hook protein FlgE